MQSSDLPTPKAAHLTALTENDPSYPQVQHKVFELTGIDLNSYKRAQMLRRLDAILSRCQLPSLAALAQELKPGSPVLQEFMERYTINVSECFRDRPRFELLAQQIIPAALRQNANLALWSAACSYGPEPYSLALILRELHAAQGSIMATDIDPKILQTAKAGESFTANDLKNLPKELVARYFTLLKDGKYKVADTLKSLVTFRQHNLLTPAPAKNFDIILCRNVTIYFTDEAKDQATEYLVNALKPGGVLFIGETETIHRPQRFGLTLRSTSFYERAAA